jgi:hypothetical protein
VTIGAKRYTFMPFPVALNIPLFRMRSSIVRTVSFNVGTRASVFPTNRTSSCDNAESTVGLALKRRHDVSCVGGRKCDRSYRFLPWSVGLEDRPWGGYLLAKNL